jgi:hypothetical protein
VFFTSCKKNANHDLAELQPAENFDIKAPFDSTLVVTFFEPSAVAKYQPDVNKLYQNMIFTTCGTIKNGVNEFANVLYNKIINLSEEGIETTIPYKPN